MRPLASPLRRLLIGMLALVLLPAWLPVRAAEVEIVARHGQSVRGQIGDAPFLVLRGERAERMEAYGALAGEDLVGLLSETLIPAVQDRRPWDLLVRGALALYRFSEQDERDMQAFIAGLHSAVTPERRMLAPLGRELNVNDLMAVQIFADLPGQAGEMIGAGCSSFAAWGRYTDDGSILVARNVDYRTFGGQFPMMVIAHDPAEAGVPRTLEISGPGILGASTAMSEHGVIVLIHDSAPLQGLTAGFTPRVLALRRALESASRPQTAVRDIATVLRNSPPSTGSNIHVVVADVSQARPAVLEWDANRRDGGVSVRQADRGAESIICTNHYLLRRDPPATLTRSSPQRFATLADHLGQPRPIDPQRAREMIHAVGIENDKMTYMSVVIRPAQRQFWVAFARTPGVSATRGPWTEFTWDTIFNAGAAD